MTKVVVAMSMSLDGIAGPESADADGMAIFTAILGWSTRSYCMSCRSWPAGAFGCSIPPRWTCAVSRPSQAREQSTCATK